MRVITFSNIFNEDYNNGNFYSCAMCSRVLGVTYYIHIKTGNRFCESCAIKYFNHLICFIEDNKNENLS